MQEIHLEPWESISETVKAWLPMIEQRKYPALEGQPETGKFYRLYPEGAVSANMGPYHGNLRVGEEPENLIVYFNGGGVSWNAYTAARPNGLFTAGLKERFYFNECEWLGDGVIDNGLASRREDNPFRSWSVIELPYATGDFHCGNGDFPYTALDGSHRILPHHGWRNTMAVIDLAKPWVGEPKRLLIAGSSAGGWGVSLMAEDVISAFPNTEDITCLVDSSLAFKDDWRAVARDVWQAPEHIWQRLHSDNIMLDSYSALYRAHEGKVRCLFDCSIRDCALANTQNSFDGMGPVFTREAGDKIQRGLRELMKTMQREMPGSGLYFFDLPSSDPTADEMGLTQHTILENPATFDNRVDGVSVAEWLFRAVNGRVETIGAALLDQRK